MRVLNKSAIGYIFKIIRLVSCLSSAIYQYFFEMVRYCWHSSFLLCETQGKLEGRIWAHYHSIERGFSLSQPTRNFGVQLRHTLLQLLHRYVDKNYDTSHAAFQAAVNCLSYYLSKHQLSRTKDILETENDLNRLLTRCNMSISQENYTGVTSLSALDINKQARLDFTSLVNSRHSIRQFAQGDLDINLIYDAVKLAGRSPSACNRQATKVHIIVDQSLLAAIMVEHNGVRGFERQISSLLIVTSDLNSFFGIEEKNQPYVDGGMFAMSLLYALHYHGLGACALNWAIKRKRDLKLRSIVKSLTNSEIIVMLIAVGKMLDTFNVACSVRKKLDEITVGP